MKPKAANFFKGSNQNPLQKTQISSAYGPLPRRQLLLASIFRLARHCLTLTDKVNTEKLSYLTFKPNCCLLLLSYLTTKPADCHDKRDHEIVSSLLGVLCRLGSSICRRLLLLQNGVCIPLTASRNRNNLDLTSFVFTENEVC